MFETASIIKNFSVILFRIVWGITRTVARIATFCGVLTFNYPKIMFTVWFALTAFIAYRIHPIMLFIAVPLAALVYFMVWRYLGSWRNSKIVAYTIAAVLEDFYGDTPIRRNTIRVRTGTVEGSYEVDFITPTGKSDADLMARLPEVAAALHTVRFIPIDKDEREGFVTVIFAFTDPLEAHLDSYEAGVLNLSDEEMEDPYHWLTVGIDASGEPFDMPLFMEESGSVRCLTAGTSGAGKSSILKQQLLQASLNPNIRVFITDGKGGSEFPQFKKHSSHFATDKKGFFEQLRLLDEEVTNRASHLEASKTSGNYRVSDAWNPTDDGYMLYWVFDELGRIFGSMKPTELMEVRQKIYGIASVARSLGIAINFSSQTFRSDILDTTTRDNCFDMAVGFKMMTLQESSYVGFEPSDEIRPDLIKAQLMKSGRTSTVGQFAIRGLGRATYGKSYYISNEDITSALANREPVQTWSYKNLVTP